MKVAKIRVNVEVPMRTAVGTGRTTLVLAAEQSAALGLSYATLVDWRKRRSYLTLFVEHTPCFTKRLPFTVTETSQLQIRSKIKQQRKTVRGSVWQRHLRGLTVSEAAGPNDALEIRLNTHPYDFMADVTKTHDLAG